jgi:carboxyl-terminal processing protease
MIALALLVRLKDSDRVTLAPDFVSVSGPHRRDPMILPNRIISMVSPVLLVSLFSVSSLMATASPATKTKSENDLQCRYLYAIEQGFLSQHIKYAQRDATLQNHVIEQYIKRIDPTKVYLLKADVDKIRTQLSTVFEKTKAKECGVLDDIQKILVTRVEERAAFAKKMLGAKYKFDSKVEIMFDPDKKSFPATEDEANEFLKKYVHFQVSNYLATDMKLKEAKSNVIKNWDRTIKRVQETKEDDIYAGYLDSFARALDPHSSFFSKDVLEDFEIQMSLSLEGIGATLSSTDGFTVVEALVPGGAAALSSHIEPQDKIVAVGQGEKGAMENVIEMDLRDVVRKIRGEKGTKVRLTILRKKGDGKSRFDVTLVRDKIKLEDEAASIIYQDKEVGGVKRKIGILNFPSFYADSKRGGRSSASDLKKLIAEARNKKVDGLVLDLSNNGGGSLDDAVKIAGLFFQTGNVVKQSSRDEGRGEATLKDSDPMVDWPGPLVVLTSRISASASEIVAGTLQDYKRAVIVGSDHTFGKGSVQSVVPIPNNLGALKVTVGMFFVPGGNSTQHRGVSADVVIPGQYDSDEIGEKSLDYSLPPKKIDAFISQEAYVKEGPSAWFSLNSDWIKTLKEKSKIRVDQSEDFKKIAEELKKNQAKGKVIKLSEVTKEKEKKEKAKAAKNASKVDKDKEYLKRADIQEATNVLGDLMLLEAQKPVATK